MKTILIAIAIATIALALCAMPAVSAPYSVDLTVDATNGVGNFTVSSAVQPDNLRLWGVLPLSPTPQTVTVTRVHGDWSETLTTFVLASNVASATATLTNAIRLVPNDVMQISGPTNATLEVQGEQ